MQNLDIQAFERFLHQHDASTNKTEATHTSMIGGQTSCPEYINSGTYNVQESEFNQLRDLILALPSNYRHGLSRYMPDYFNFVVDIDTGVFKQRPTVEALRDWAIMLAMSLQNLIVDSVQDSVKPCIVISIISARKVKGGFKPGIHLHVCDFIVDRQTAIYLSTTLASKIVFPLNLRLPCTDVNKLIDSGLYKTKGGALRMHNATKISDQLTRYKIIGVLDSNGDANIDPMLTPLEMYEFTKLDPEFGQPFKPVQLKIPQNPLEIVKRPIEIDEENVPKISRTEAPTLDSEFQELLTTKIEQLFPQAKIRQIARQNGTVWIVKLKSVYCWLKKSDHDSDSAFLSVTKNGIQARCSSTVCKMKQELQRVACFSGEEVVKYFGANMGDNQLPSLMPEDPIAKGVVDEYNQRFAFVMVGESNCNLAVVERSTDPLTGGQNVRFMTSKVFSDWYRDDRTQDGRIKADIWMNSPRQARYKNIVFMPGVDTEANGWFNLWQGFPWQIYDDWVTEGIQTLDFYMSDPDLKPALDFIFTTICSSVPDNFNYVLNWLAFAIQRPDQPGDVTLALRGARGIGKTFFGQIAAKLFGNYGKVIEAKQMAADFNGHLKNCIMLVADEASGQYDPEVMVRLQNLATSEYLSINQKNVEQFRVKNCLHIILISNFTRMVAAGRDARRYCILEVASIHKKDAVYFDALSKTLTPTFYCKFLTMLQMRNIQGWIKTDWPIGSQKPLWENKQVALNPTEHWFYAKLRDATEETWRTIQSKDFVCKEVAEYETVRRQIPRPIAVEQELNAVLSGHQVCTNANGKGVPSCTVAGKKVPAYRFPTLSECREAFSEYVETNSLILWGE